MRLQVPFKDADDKLIGIKAIPSLSLSQKPPFSEIKLSKYMPSKGKHWEDKLPHPLEESMSLPVKIR